MGLPYDSTILVPPNPYDGIDPELDQEILGFDPAAFPATNPFIDELEAQIAAESAQAPMPMPEEEPQGGPEVAPEPALPADEFVPDIDAAVDRVAQDTGALGMADAMPPGFEDQGGFQQPEGQLGADLEIQPLTDERAGDTLLEPDIAGIDPSIPAPQDMTDEALQMRAYEFQQQQEAEKERLGREEIQADAERKVRNAQVYEQRLSEADQRSEEVFARASELATEKVDKDRYTKNMSWGQKAAGLLSILAGGQLGLLSGRGGNEALSFFIGEINRDIDEQKFNIENAKDSLQTQKGLVADLYRQTGNAYEAAETARLAMFEAAVAEIDNQVARLDPAGSQALELEMKKRELAAQAEQHRAEVRAQHQKGALETAKFELEALDTQSQMDKRSAEIAKMAAETQKLGRRGGGGSGRVKEPDIGQKLAAAKEGLVWDPTIGDFVRKGGEGALETKEEAMARKYRADADLSERNASEQERDETLGVGGITGNGKVVRFVDSKARGEVAARKAYLDEVTRLYDNIRIARKKHGFESSFIDSDEYRSVKADHAKLVTMIKSPEGANLGVIAGPDEKLINNLIATGDPGEYRNFEKAMEHSRSLWVDSFNDYTSAQARVGYKPDKYSPKRRDPARAPKRKSSAEKTEIVTAPTAPDSQGNRAQDVANRLPTLKAFVKESGNPMAVRRMGETIKNQVDSGEIPRQVAWDLVDQSGMAEIFAKSTKFGLEKEYEKTKDPKTKAMLDEASRIADGLGTHKENYEFLTGDLAEIRGTN